MGTKVLPGPITAQQRFYLSRQGVMVTRVGADKWITDHSADYVATLLQGFDAKQFATDLAKERCPPVPVPVPVLTLLIKAALGQPLTPADQQLLQDQLTDLVPQCELHDAVTAANSAADINAAAGGNLWPI